MSNSPWRNILADLPNEPVLAGVEKKGLTPHRVFVYALPQYALLRVSGHDAEKFLQGQLTCDVVALTPERWQPGACCNPKGRMIATFFIRREGSNFLLVLEQALVAALLSQLGKYSVFFQTEMTELPEHYLLGASCTDPAPLKALRATTGAIEISTIRGDVQQRALLQVDATKLMQRWAMLKSTTTAVVGPQQWKKLQIALSEVYLEASTSETFLPHDIGLPDRGGVSFSKGCYTGQEIIARMEYRGKLKHHLARVQLNQAQCPDAGTQLRQSSDNSLVGRWLCGLADSNNTIGLMSLNDKLASQTEFDIEAQIQTILTVMSKNT